MLDSVTPRCPGLVTAKKKKNANNHTMFFLERGGFLLAIPSKQAKLV